MRVAETPPLQVEPAPEASELRSEWENARAHQQSGDQHRVSGDLSLALEDYRAAASIMERLVAARPDNATWRRDLSLSQDKIDDVLLAQGNFNQALENFHAALTTRQLLAGTDPENREWQRNLSVSHNKVGDAFNAQGNLKAALESYLVGYGIAHDLAGTAPDNVQWQIDLAACQHRIGGILLAVGNLTGAIVYSAALALGERLAHAEPNSPSLQRDLAISHAHLAEAYRRSSQGLKAMQHFKDGREIIVDLVQKDPESAQLRKDLTWFDVQIAVPEK